MVPPSTRKKPPAKARAPRRRRSTRTPIVATDALPVSSFPTPGEIEELGRFADRVAVGEENLTYIKV